MCLQESARPGRQAVPDQHSRRLWPTADNDTKLLPATQEALVLSGFNFVEGPDGGAPLLLTSQEPALALQSTALP